MTFSFGSLRVFRELKVQIIAAEEIKYFRRKEKKLRIIHERFIKTFQTLVGLGNAKGIKIFSRRRIPKAIKIHRAIVLRGEL
jgi:hypothetical protein